MVEWSGQDDASGSGIHSYDLYVSRDDGPFEKVATHLTETSHEFTGESGSTYGFVSLARDNVGNVEPMPLVADTETLVIIGAWVNRVDVYDVDAQWQGHGARRAGDHQRDGQTPRQRSGHVCAHAASADGYAPPYYDVTEDGKITALDALRVINQMARISAGAMGEASAENVDALTAPLLELPQRVEPTSYHDSAGIEPRLAEEIRPPEFASRPTMPASSMTAIPYLAASSEDLDGGELESTLSTLADDVAGQWSRF